MAQANVFARLAGELRPRGAFDAWLVVVGLAAALASVGGALALEASGVDLAISDLFYDRAAHRWLIDFDHDHGLRYGLYRIPKYLIAGLTVGLVLLLFAPASWRRGVPRHAIACALSFWLFSVTVSALKDVTDVYYPRQIARYQPVAQMPPAGQWIAADKPLRRIPYRRLWEAYDPPRPAGIQRGRGFPGAHATAGFYLMGLAALARSRRGRRNWLIAGSLAGWSLGLYQTLNGNHFVSHTLVSWGIAALFLAWLWMAWRPERA